MKSKAELRNQIIQKKMQEKQEAEMSDLLGQISDIGIDPMSNDLESLQEEPDEIFELDLKNETVSNSITDNTIDKLTKNFVHDYLDIRDNMKQIMSQTKRILAAVPMTKKNLSSPAQINVIMQLYNSMNQSSKMMLDLYKNVREIYTLQQYEIEEKQRLEKEAKDNDSEVINTNLSDIIKKIKEEPQQIEIEDVEVIE